MALGSCCMCSGHTPGNDLGRTAEPGELNCGVSNPRRVGSLLFPACEDSLGGPGGKNPCDSTAEKAMQHSTVGWLGRVRAPRTTRLSTAVKELSRRNDPSCHWTQASEAERVGLCVCAGLSTMKPFTHGFRCVSLSSSAAMGEWRSNRRRWSLGVVVTIRHVGGPRGRSSLYPGQQGSPTPFRVTEQPSVEQHY